MLIGNYKKICFGKYGDSMDVENQRIVVRVNNFNEAHFNNLGYFVKRNDYIEIFVKELPVGSGLKIDVQCNYCGIVFQKAYRRYLESKNDICCKSCAKIKMMNTSLLRYGNICSLRNEDVQNKSKERNVKNLGVQYPFQNKNILKKCLESLDANGGREGFNVSKPQIYLHNLYGGKLNHFEFPYKIDILFESENIYFEYDGSGHKMGIKFGNFTEEEFIKKEEKRSLFLKNKGYKEFRIISSNDVFPPDEELLNIKNKAFDVLIKNNFSKYIYNLDTKTESFEE